MAVATPTMFPVPTLPDRAMQKASNEETPFFPVCSLFLNSSLVIRPMRRSCTKPVRMEK